MWRGSERGSETRTSQAASSPRIVIWSAIFACVRAKVDALSTWRRLTLSTWPGWDVNNESQPGEEHVRLRACKVDLRTTVSQKCDPKDPTGLNTPTAFLDRLLVQGSGGLSESSFKGSQPQVNLKWIYVKSLAALSIDTHRSGKRSWPGPWGMG